MLQKAVGYSTDGYQFFGLSAKLTNEPEILSRPKLANEVYQYEFDYTALQSEKLHLDGEQRIVFYGLFRDNHEEAVTTPYAPAGIQAIWASLVEPEKLQRIEAVQLRSTLGSTLTGSPFTKAEIAERYPQRRLEEKDTADGLLSFFLPTHEHVVTQAKEMLMERQHGHILMSGHNDRVTGGTIATNVFMYGIFNSQIAVGNVNMNKWLSHSRNSLNRMKTSGQRIYVELNGNYHLLTMPSLFEMGFNYARWYYKLNNDVITITNFTAVDTPEIQLQVTSEQGIDYKYLITNQITMQNNEYEVDYQVEEDGNAIIFQAAEGAESKQTYPDLTYRMAVTGTEAVTKDESFLANHIESGDASLVILELAAAKQWTMTMGGDLYGKGSLAAVREWETETVAYRAFFQTVMGNFNLTAPGTDNWKEVDKVNTIAWWYTHNMLVHFSVPHGLEQYGGAAWGTRDISQGPFEYFMTTQNDETVREIIQTLFSHQYEDTGNWPQWFMFDQYNRVQQASSHGDIIVWPLKVIGDYILATNDFTILDEEIPYTDPETFQFTAHKEILLLHLKKEIAYIQNHFLHDTYLSSYGDGDWDDTLQPANQNLKQYMTSSWTVALTYEVLSNITSVLSRVDETAANDMQQLVDGIKADFDTYIMSSDVIPGFVYMEEPGKPEFMLHPTDTKTGIHYRLLPMQQSIISELFTPEQAAQHLQIMKEFLAFPDGMRLMNRPAHYAGGVSAHFKRAEQAANFGREIGLQYVHAHIRYIEAMAKLGMTDKTWDQLAVINPIAIQDVVSNAEIRQSNAYFSSSDGDFKTRYDAHDNFEQLRDGTRGVKGGWRIYSSGPGIYMNQLIANTLGIRRSHGNLVVDPVLPERLDGLQLDFTWNKLPVRFNYHFNHSQTDILINGQSVSVSQESNPYRSGGLMIAAEDLDQLLKEVANTIDIYWS